MLAFVATPEKSTKITLEIPAGVATDAGSTNGAQNAEATLSINYAHSSSGTSAAASAASWGLAGSLALSIGAATLAPGGK